MKTIGVRTAARSQAVDITREVRIAVAESGVEEGWAEIFVPHTTAGVAINEAADPAVMEDLLAALDRMVPWEAGYRHGEGNAAAHVKAVLTGSTARVPVRGGRLHLGTWQGVFFLEFDGPRNRKADIFIHKIVS